MINEATIAFIRQHADADIRQLALQGTKDPEVDLPFVLDQIAGRQTARYKLPSWAAKEGIIYPPHLSMEQCSSELTACYKAELTNEGRLLVDLTGGFGVDFSFMARSFSKAVYVEQQEHLCDIARQNFNLLGLQQAEVVCGNGEEYLKTMEPADLIYIDPARRDDHGERTYAIGDCTPDVLSLRDQLLSKASRVLLKLSPMLDWRKALCDLGTDIVSEVHIVSVGNECKELLIMAESKKKLGNIPVHCINLHANGSRQQFTFHQMPPSDNPPSTFCLSSFTRYIYEPNASIMKAGCFAALSQRFGIGQLAQNSHLLASEVLVANFPGRVFQLDAVTSMNKRELRQHLQGLTQANITVRNFPLTVAELRRRLKLSEGGSTYIFATTLASGDRVLLICRKVD